MTPVQLSTISQPRVHKRHLGHWCADTELFCYSLLWLMVLIFIGSIAQSSFGLYAAQNKYFSSWFIWTGFIPLPGGRLTMLVVFINLLAKLVFESPLKIRRAGVIVSHIGALLLLVGGMITAYQAIEGNMVIEEGKQSNFFSDHHLLEIAVTKHSDETTDQVSAFTGGYIKAGQTLDEPGIGGTMTVESYYDNCDVVSRPDGPLEDGHGICEINTIVHIPNAREMSQNRAGATIRIADSQIDGVDGLYLILEHFNETPIIDSTGQEVGFIALRGKRYRLPFSVKLNDFSYELHPGTGMARDYRSAIEVVQGGTPIKATIWMNHPLREGGYTFYQSSYGDGVVQTTVLSVVRNAGRLFPYISSIVICIGLLIHLVILFVESRKLQHMQKEMQQS